MLDKRNFYINGKWVKPLKSNDFEVINPSNEEPFAVISLGSKDDTDAAVNAAKKAFLKKNISTRRMENRDAKLPPELTRSQRSRIFQSLKYIDFMANEVKKGNRSTKAFADLNKSSKSFTTFTLSSRTIKKALQYQGPVNFTCARFTYVY